MIKKLPFEITQGEYEGKTFDIKSHTSPYDMQEKINELVDTVNTIQKEREAEKCKTPSENVLTKSLRIDKEFAEDECARLQAELERTRKALEIAVDALKDNLSQANFREMLDASRFHCIRTKCELALEQITELEQKDHFADTSKKVEQKDK